MERTTKEEVVTPLAPAAAQDAQKPTKTRPAVTGWLLLVCLYIAVLNPIIFFLRYVDADNRYALSAPVDRIINPQTGEIDTNHADVSALNQEYHKIHQMEGTRRWLELALMVMSVYAGVQLWRRGTKGLSLAKGFLVLQTSYIIVMSFLFPQFWGLQGRSDAWDSVSWHTITAIISLGYLSVSKRVRSTYLADDGMRHCPICGARALPNLKYCLNHRNQTPVTPTDPPPNASAT
jgi:Protein of unknown function (DUF2569)